MTFSIAARCARTGQFGITLATSALAVGSRVPALRAGVGAVIVQYWSDPGLARRGIDLVSSGCAATEAVAAMVASTPHHAWRQMAVIDAAGRTASATGDKVRPVIGEAHGKDCIAIGNIVTNDQVVPAMVAAFEQRPGDDLPDRLLYALNAGLAAGGEPKPLRSAVMQVVDKHPFPIIDLRIDMDDDPIGALGDLWAAFSPRLSEFLLRVDAPDRLA